MTEKEVNNGFFRKYGWIIISSIGIFIIPYLLTFLIYLIFGIKDGPDIGTENLNTLGKSFYAALEQKMALIIGFILALSYTLILSTLEHFKTEKNLIEKLEYKVDSYLNKTKIVFESGINEFDSEHLFTLKKIINELCKIQLEGNKETINIYALDNSDPRTWWSDTMTGYLALLSNWHSHNDGIKNGNVYRIFVCSKNELLSPIFAKTIALHSLMGFRTYVFTYKMYDELFNNYYNELKEPLIEKKELFIWAKKSVSEIKENSIPIFFNTDTRRKPKGWQNVKGYQSFWDVGSDYNSRLDSKRKVVNPTAYYDKNKPLKDVNILFNFIAKEKDDNEVKSRYWDELAEQHIGLMQYLIGHSVCCKDDNEVPEHLISEKKQGIEIKTLSCVANCAKKEECPNHSEDNGASFYFVPQEDISMILEKYYSIV